MCADVYPVLYTLCSLTGVSVIKGDITRCPAQGPSSVSPQLPHASQAGTGPPSPGCCGWHVAPGTAASVCLSFPIVCGPSGHKFQLTVSEPRHLCAGD